MPPRSRAILLPDESTSTLQLNILDDMQERKRIAKRQRDAKEGIQHLRKEVERLLKTGTEIVGTDRGKFQNKNRNQKSGEETETPGER